MAPKKKKDDAVEVPSETFSQTEADNKADECSVYNKLP